MPKSSALPPALNLTVAKQHDGNTPLSPTLMSSRSTQSPMTPRSMPGSPLPQHMTMQLVGAIEPSNGGRVMNSPGSPRVTAMPEFPPSPDRDGIRHTREPSRSFFSNFKASKSSHMLHSPEASIAEVQEKTTARSRASSKDRSLHSLKKQESTPDLPRMIANNSKTSHDIVDDVSSGLVPPGSSDGASTTRTKSRSKLGVILTRNKTPKTEDERKQRARLGPPLNMENHSLQNGNKGANGATSLKNASVKPDYRERAFANTIPTSRSRSADRLGKDDMSSISSMQRPGTTPSLIVSSLPKENSSLLSNIGHTGKGVGDRLGKAGKGFFNKMTRSGSSNEREPLMEENYACTTISLPLVAQTRKTRIAKKLELSRDKTEFWMPALPWRCIDYLNMNGCEEEGLYRIPGSGREVKMWQKRFDMEHDIDLFEEPELYDINTIGSMFKSWLRELPDEIMPKTVQNKISQQCTGATTVPQLLKDELSKLPPFNYYLLFAITCHLSLLHSFADKNKMDYRNLCICFQPCLKIDALCFQFLVINWKECWQGCWTEHEYLQEEYRWEKEGSLTSRKDTSSIDERAISSSDSGHVISAFHQSSKSPEAGISRKSSMPHLSMKQRSLSSGAGSIIKSSISHSNSSSMPSVPQRITTPEQSPVPDQKLPELTNLSPIRMQFEETKTR